MRVARFLFIGDLHYSGVNPENYISNYKEDFYAQMMEVKEIVFNMCVDAILTPGDIFNSHIVSNTTLLELADMIQSSCNWYTIIGNHDIIGYNLDSYERSSLKVLERLCDNLEVIETEEQRFYSRHCGDVYFSISGTSYSDKMDVNGYGYFYPTEEEIKENFTLNWYLENYIKIHIAHGMLLEKKPPFEKYTLINKVKTMADLILCGHDHAGFGIKVLDKTGNINSYNEFKWSKSDQVKVFCNPGAFMRIRASKQELEREIQIAVIEIYDNGITTIKLIPLESAKPGYEVLSRDKIEENNEREYAMSQFAALIQNKAGEKVTLDTLQIIEELGQAEGIPKYVINEALKLVSEGREKTN